MHSIDRIQGIFMQYRNALIDRKTGYFYAMEEMHSIDRIQGVFMQ